jgi:hypothetical protein
VLLTSTLKISRLLQYYVAGFVLLLIVNRSLPFDFTLSQDSTSLTAITTHHTLALDRQSVRVQSTSCY